MLKLAAFLKRKVFLIIPVLVVLPLLVAFSVLTIIDIRNPQQSRRFTLLWKLGLVKETKLSSNLFVAPRADEMWQETDLYWYPKNQQTLSDEFGYDCNIIGTVLEKDNQKWQIKTKNGQVFTLNVGEAYLPKETYKYLVPQYDENGRLVELKTEPDEQVKELVQQGDLVLAKWTCPENDPSVMKDDDGKAKENYLHFLPASISLLKEI